MSDIAALGLRIFLPDDRPLQGPTMMHNERAGLAVFERDQVAFAVAQQSSDPLVMESVTRLLVITQMVHSEVVTAAVADRESALQQRSDCLVSDVLKTLVALTRSSNIDTLYALDNFLEVAARAGLYAPTR